MSEKLFTQVELEKACRIAKAVGQIELVQGYYIRCHNQPEIEEVVKWLEDDLEYLKQEKAVIEIEGLV